MGKGYGFIEREDGGDIFWKSQDLEGHLNAGIGRSLQL